MTHLNGTAPAFDLLIESHAQQLAASAIAEHVIAERGYRSIADGAVKAVRDLAWECTTGFGDKLLRQVLHQGALAFPIYRLGTATPYAWVLRPDHPRSDEEGKPIKYEWPWKTPNVFDVLPRYADALGNPDIPIWITEGAKKADALASAYDDRIVPINLNGVYGWRAKNTFGAATASADMELIAWEGRQIIIAPDGDVKFNVEVRKAVERLAKLLVGRYRVAEVLILYLPMERGGPKVGVDDYLAQGHTTDELEQQLSSIAAVTATASVQMGVHPETQDKLYLPPGYDVRHASIVRMDKHGEPTPVYSGGIFVQEVGIDLHTGEQNATVAWNGRGDVHCELTVPYTALSDTKEFSHLIGAAGAAIGPRNIKDVQQFLVEFAQHNIDVLPRRAHADRLGLVGGGLVLPAGAVGFDETVRYVGRPAVRVGSDADAYKVAIRTLLTWPQAWPAWLILGLSLAAPAIARLKLRRNPVVYLSGPSSSSKTTIAQFGTGCWGDPARQPLRVESGRTTPAGIFQTLEHLGGLPVLVDEAHTVPDPKRLELACYGFANGQTYTKGGVDGKARGGEALGGALLLAGEALPEFRHAGSRLRVLWVDTGLYPPLGAEPRSEEGKRRAQQLEHAWNAGAGLFGLEVARHIWADWNSFTAEIRTAAADTALAPLGPWCEPLAAAAAALDVAFKVADVRVAPAGFDLLLDRWAELLLSGQHDTDPATDAWEALVTMLAQGRRHNDGDVSEVTHQPIPGSAQWEYIEADRGGGIIACRKVEDSDCWRVLTSTPQFKERVGVAAVQLYGQAWLKRGWVLPSKDGKSTHFERVYPSGAVRVLKVPDDKLGEWEP